MTIIYNSKYIVKDTNKFSYIFNLQILSISKVMMQYSIEILNKN